MGYNVQDLKELLASKFDFSSPVYYVFKEKIKSLSVTNVTAERNVRLISDFISKNHTEEKLQDSLQIVKKNRKDFPKTMTKQAFN